MRKPKRTTRQRGLKSETGPIPVTSAAWADPDHFELDATLADGRVVRAPALDDDPTYQQVLGLGMEIAPFLRWPDLDTARAAVKAAVKAEAARRIETGPADWRMIRALERGEETTALAAQREAIRAASDALETAVMTTDAETLTAFDVTDDAHWPN